MSIHRGYDQQCPPGSRARGEKGADGAKASRAYAISCAIRHATRASTGSRPVGTSSDEEHFFDVAPSAQGRLPHIVAENGQADSVVGLDSRVCVRRILAG